ncbi:hypothetical protein [Nitrosomonas cryotolerans]|uniref:hypothetical protein n=1 Tax=Nitrosomonas cryotolerans TaxID=44575 RepID=UPI000A63852D|nr:hypothetical protein [Nitrosomonas cryotolerans]
MPRIIRADELTANFGAPDCRQLRQHIFSDLSSIAGGLVVHHVKIAERTSLAGKPSTPRYIGITREVTLQPSSLGSVA